MKEFNLDDFNSKSWAKRSGQDLKKYISYAIKEINKREFTDVVAKEAHRRLGEEITGYTKKGKLSARMIGKTKEELLFEARNLRDFLNWDYTSDIGKKELQGKYKDAYLQYIDKDYHMNISQEAYENYVELLFAFKDLSDAYDSEQIKEWVDIVENAKSETGVKYLSFRDLQKAMLEYADNDIKKNKHGGLTETERKNAVTDILMKLIEERSR